MLCENCGKREANVKYSENINGKKKELNLCEECSHSLGITGMDFNMPIDFSNLFEGFFDDFEGNHFLPMLKDIETLKCNTCGYTFEDIARSGKLGCNDCYEVFQDRLDPIIKKIQGSNKHVGRIGKIIDSRVDESLRKNKDTKKDSKKDGNEADLKENQKENPKILKLENELKQAIKEERYEDAAKLRDEIKKLEN